MTRRAVSLEFIGGKGMRQRMWEAIRRLGGSGRPFTEDDIWSACEGAEVDIDKGAIRDYRRALVAAGILRRESEPARCVLATYVLVEDEGVEAPRINKSGQRVTQGLAQEQMWRTLRMVGGDINARELAAHASTPQVPVAEVAAKYYLFILNASGYLDCTVEGKGRGKGGTQARYRLKRNRNTGPRPPMVCKTKCVYDANEGKVVWQPVITDEDAIYAK